MRTRFDAIVVGGRCAGAVMSLLLARAGWRVLCLERSEAGQDTISTHYIHREGAAWLAEWGLLSQLIGTRCPPIRSVRYRFEEVVLDKLIPADEPAAYAPRRSILDRILASAAADAGAEVRHRCRATDVLRSDGRVVGVRAATEHGTPFVETARLVIGADGINSTVAKRVDAHAYLEHPARTCVYYSYWAGLDAAHVRAGLTIRNRRAALAMPTHGDAVLVAVIWPRDQLRHVRDDIETNYLDTIEAIDPRLREQLSGATRAERFTGTGHLPAFFRNPVGPGWALIGDAGLHKDPLPASGICDAWQQADALATQLLAGDRERVTLERALARFARARDAHFLEPYEATYQLSGMSFSRDQLDLLARRAEESPLTPDSMLRQLVHVFAQPGTATSTVVT